MTDCFGVEDSIASRATPVVALGCQDRLWKGSWLFADHQRLAGVEMASVALEEMVEKPSTAAAYEVGTRQRRCCPGGRGLVNSENDWEVSLH